MTDNCHGGWHFWGRRQHMVERGEPCLCGKVKYTGDIIGLTPDDLVNAGDQSLRRFADRWKAERNALIACTVLAHDFLLLSSSEGVSREAAAVWFKAAEMLTQATAVDATQKE